MSIRPEAHSPFDRNEWFSLARQRLRWGVNTRITKLCGHQFCDLTQTQCCACTDNRPHSARYYKYVDGRGMVPEAKRWSAYCPGCQIQYGEPEEGPDAMPDVRMERDEREFMTRCVSCGLFGHILWECPRNIGGVDTPLPRVSGMTVTTTSTSMAPATQISPPPPSTRSQPSHTSPTASARIDFRRPSASAASTTRETINNSAESASSSSSSTRMLSPPRPVPRLTDHQQRRARIQAHFERSFGSLSDIANDPDYVSPITSLYSNAYARFQERDSERSNRDRTAEQARWPPVFQFGSNQPSPTPTSPSSQSSVDRLPTNSTTPEQTASSFSFGTVLPPVSAVSSTTHQSPSAPNRPTGDREERPSPSQTRYRPATNILRADENLSQNTRSILENLRRRLEEDDRELLSTITNDHDTPDPPSTASSRNLPRPRYLDPERFYQLYYPNHTSPGTFRFPSQEEPKVPRPKSPEPLSKEELTISNECKVCFSQHCDMLLLPCAHLALCEVPTAPIFWSCRLMSSGVPRGRILRSQLDGSTINVSFVAGR